MDKSSKKPVKVYFCAPTVFSAEREEIFDFIREVILKLGCVLTYDWMNDKKQYSPKEIFEKSMEAIKTADLVIAEVTFPSTGVGQQIAFAVESGVPVLALHAGWKKGSNRFLAGSQSEKLTYSKYEKDNLATLIKANLPSFNQTKLAKFNFISTTEINSELDRVGKELGISRSQLVRKIVNEWAVKKGLHDA